MVKKTITNWNEKDFNIHGYDALKNGVNGTIVSEERTTSIFKVHRELTWNTHKEYVIMPARAQF
jgi:hypothetical protein